MKNLLRKQLGMLLVCVMLCGSVFASLMYASGGKLTYHYDQNGRLISVISDGGQIIYEYDRNGNLLTRKSSANLVFNSSFETYSGKEGSADGWNRFVAPGVQPDYQVEAVAGATGGRAQKLASSSMPAGEGLNVWQDVAIKGKTAYTVSGRLQISGLQKAKVAIMMYYFDANDKLVGGEEVFQHASNTPWISFAAPFTTGEGVVKARVHVGLAPTSAGGSGIVFADAVEIKQEAPSNLVFNSGFETYSGKEGLSDGWNQYVAPGVQPDYQVEAVTGAIGMRAQKLASSGMPAGEGLNVWQDVAVKGKTTYTASGRLQISGLQKAKVAVTMYYFDANDKLVGGEEIFQHASNTSWISFAAPFTTGEGVVKARVHVGLAPTSAGGSGIVFADAVEIKQETPSNLVFNSGFETYSGKGGSADGWNRYVAPGVQPVYKVEAVAGAIGVRAQKLESSGMPAGEGLNVWQDVAVKGKTTYTVSGRLQISDLQKAKATITMYYFDANDKLVGGEEIFQHTSDTPWMSYSVPFIPADSAVKARVHIGLAPTSAGGTGVIYADEVEIRKEALVNLVFNPDFEKYSGNTDLADGWTRYVSPGVQPDYQVLEVEGATGEQAQKIAASNMPAGEGLNIWQDVAVKGNTDYTVSGRLQISGLQKAKASITMYYFDENDKLVGGEEIFQHASNTPWMSMKAPITPSEGAIRARVHIGLVPLNVGGTGALFVDGIVISP